MKALNLKALNPTASNSNAGFTPSLVSSASVKTLFLGAVLSLCSASAFADKPFLGASASLGGGANAGAHIGGLSVGAGVGKHSGGYGVHASANSEYVKRYASYKNNFKNNHKKGKHYGQYKDHPRFGVNPSVSSKTKVNCQPAGLFGLVTVCK